MASRAAWPVHLRVTFYQLDNPVDNRLALLSGPRPAYLLAFTW